MRRAARASSFGRVASEVVDMGGKWGVEVGVLLCKEDDRICENSRQCGEGGRQIGESYETHRRQRVHKEVVCSLRGN